MKVIYILESIIIIISILAINIKKEKKEIKLIMDKSHTEIMKGLAIIIIIISHLGGIFGLRVFTPLGGIGVSIFLIISGYGLSKSYQSNKLNDFWEKKFLRVFMPYYIIRIIYTIITHEINWKAILLDILFIKPLNPYGWYMNYIMLMYIIFYLIQNINIPQKIRNKIYFFISLFMIFTMSEIKAEQSFSFFIGVIYAFNSDIIERKFIKKNNNLMWLIFILISIFALIFKQISIVRNFYPIYLFMQINIKLFGAIGAILFIYSYRKLICKFNFSFFSNISFELYLIHGYIIYILYNSSIINVLMFFMLSIIISTILKIVNDYIVKIIKS